MSKALEKIELLKSLANDGRIAYDTTKYNEWLKTIEKPLKALEIIKNYGYFDEQGDLIVHLPTNRKQEHELLNEVLL